VTNEADGAPIAALAPPVAPMAPDPFVPDGSAPVKVTTVIDDTMLRDRLAVTVTLLKTDGAKVRQISASPGCPLVRFTRAQVKPPPVTLVTVVPPLIGESAEMNANSSSFGTVVENAEVVIELLADVASPKAILSIANWPGGGGAVTTSVTVVGWLRLPLVPVIVRVDVPAGVELNVLMASVEDPNPLMVTGLKLPVAPAGNPLTLRFTVPENPPEAATFTV
jgi:hypothetical protein